MVTATNNNDDPEFEFEFEFECSHIVSHFQCEDIIVFC